MRISFLVPVYDTDVAVLRLCINSALKAAAEEHEVIIVDDGSHRAETREFLDRSEACGVENLKILRNPQNSGVSYSLNKAAAAATGEFYAPVDHDDMVVTDGVNHMLKYIIYYRSMWAYSDEVQITYKGVPRGFMLKPIYSPQLLRSVMYINHLQLFSAELFNKVGGYREGFEGSQDHDLALRLSEKTIPAHVDVIAYLWRRGMTSQSVHYGEINENSIQASCQALEQHFERLKLTPQVKAVTLPAHAELSAQPTGTYISRILPATVPKVSIVIPCKLGTTTMVEGVEVKVLEHCLQSISSSIPNSDSHTLESPPI
jgi:glycosyltransferase involved in cell wall biosynthesis